MSNLSHSKTFRIFISSTFADLQDERNALQASVFPRLRELCIQYGYRFQAVDLRWGIGSEEASHQRTMQVCLQEIERCQRVTPRPNFIVLLGERYGWRPLPDEIAASRLEEILPNLGPPEVELLLRCYRRDDNAVPPVYCLQSRLDVVTDAGEWNATERQLRLVFDRLSRDFTVSDEERIAWTASATEKEIRCGVLSDGGDLGRTFAYIRSTGASSPQPLIRELYDVDSDGNLDEIASERQTQLIALCCERLGAHAKLLRADPTHPELYQSYLSELCEAVFRDLSAVILEEIRSAPPETSLDREREIHTVFGGSRIENGFVGRDQVLTALLSYVGASEPRSLVLAAEAGAGKSTVMAFLAGQIRRQFPKTKLVTRFVGATPESTDTRTLLRDLCRDIAVTFGQPDYDPPQQLSDLVREFNALLHSATKDKPLVVLLDGVDQLSFNGEIGARSAAWVGAFVPKHCRLILSVADGEGLSALQSRFAPSQFVRLPQMSPEEGQTALAGWLSRSGRTLQPAQSENLLVQFLNCPRPLFLRFAFEAARRLRSDEPYPRLGATLADAVESLLARLAQESSHGKSLVHGALNCLAASRFGLAEDELLDLLSLDPDLMQDFRRRSPDSPPADRLPVVVWSRLNYDLQPYLAERIAEGGRLLCFYHRAVEETVRDRFLTPQRRTTHARLADYFAAQGDFLSGPGGAQPNHRKVTELCFQWCRIGAELELQTALCRPSFIEAQLQSGRLLEYFGELTRVSAAPNAVIELLLTVLRQDLHFLVWRPELFLHLCRDRARSIEDSTFSEWIKNWSEFRAQTNSDRELVQFLTPPIEPQRDADLTLRGHEGEVTATAVLGDGTLLVSGAVDATVRVWNLLTGEEIAKLEGHRTTIVHLACSSDGQWIASAPLNYDVIRVWDWQAQQEIQEIEMPSRTQSLAFKDDSSALIIQDANGTREEKLSISRSSAVTQAPARDAGLFDHSTDGSLIYVTHRRPERAVSPRAKTRGPHTKDITKIDVTSAGDRVMTLARYNSAWIWDAAAGKPLFSFTDGAGILDAGFSSDGRTFYSTSWSGSVCLRAIENGEILGGFNCGKVQEDLFATISPTGDAAASWGDWNNLNLRVWDVASREMRFVIPKVRLKHVAFSPDGCLIAAGQQAAGLRLWRADRGEELTMLGKLESGEVSWTSCFSPDGRLIAAGVSMDVLVWEVASAKLLQRFVRDDGDIHHLAFSADGKTIFALAHWASPRAFGDKCPHRILKLSVDAGAVEVFYGLSDVRILARGAAAFALGGVVETTIRAANGDVLDAVPLTPSLLRADARGTIWAAASGARLDLFRVDQDLSGSLPQKSPDQPAEPEAYTFVFPDRKTRVAREQVTWHGPDHCSHEAICPLCGTGFHFGSGDYTTNLNIYFANAEVGQEESFDRPIRRLGLQCGGKPTHPADRGLSHCGVGTGNNRLYFIPHEHADWGRGRVRAYLRAIGSPLFEHPSLELIPNEKDLAT